MYIPNLEKLQSLNDINLSHNELARSKYMLYFMKYMNIYILVPDSLYLLENLQRVDVSHNCIKELSTLIGWFFNNAS